MGYGFVGTNLRLHIDRHFGDWKVSRGDILLYLAEQCRSIINKRTDEGRGPSGRFKPYAKINNIWKRDENGKLLSDAKGRRIALPPQDDPRTVVALRSLQDVPDDKRMRSWLQIQPKRIDPNVNSIRLVQRGGRETPYGEHMGHALRAMRCVDTGRQHIVVTQQEFHLLLSKLRSEGAVRAFIERRSQRLAGLERTRAKAKLARQLRRTQLAEKRASMTAEQRHKAALRKAKNWHIKQERKRARIEAASDERRRRSALKYTNRRSRNS